MAEKVFNNVTNWSTYQDRQLDVLTSLEKSFTVSLNMSKVIKDNLSMMQSAMTSMIQSANSLTNYVNNLTASRAGGYKKSSNAKAAREAVDQYRRQIEEIHKIEIQNQQDIYESSMQSLEEQLKITREELEETRQRKKTQKEIHEAQMDLVHYIGKEAMNLVSTLGKMADNYLATSNNLIKISGSSGSLVKDARNEIVRGVVGQLNRETGGVYSPQDSYQKLVSVASEASVGNLEALKEMSRPLLLADESMDASLGDIAKLFNRFYTRYSFSSIEMEEMVNEIRGNTAGNAATAQATANNIASLESWISLNSKGDTEKLSEMMDSISHYTSWLESMNIDSSRYTKDLESIAWGDAHQDVRLISLLESVGSSTKEAQEMLREGQWDKVTELIAKAEKDLWDRHELGDSDIPGIVLDALEQDRKSIDTYNALMSEGATTLDEFINTTKDAPTAVETIEDKFVSWTDRASHWLESIANNVANLQQVTGVSFTDIVKGIGIIAALIKVHKMIDKIGNLGGGGLPQGVGNNGGLPQGVGNSLGSTLLSSTQSIGINSALKGAMTTPASMEGASMALGKVAGLGGGLGGTAMLAGGVLAGGALAVDGIKGAFEEDKDTTSRVLSGVEGAAGVGGAATLLAAGVTNPIGWAVLAVGGIALLAKNINDAVKKVGAADAVEKAYDEAAIAIRGTYKKQENSLLDVKVSLDEYSDLVTQGKATEEDLQKRREELINSGILSEEDVAKAREANIEGLKVLTDSYLEATSKFSTEAENILADYKKNDMEYASALHGDLETLLQKWNDDGKLKSDSEELAATENLMFSLYESMQDRANSGEEFSGSTKKIYDDLVKSFKDGKLSEKEANMIIDEGTWNTAFQNADFKVEDITKAVSRMEATNDTGAAAVAELESDLGTYYGLDKDTEAVELMAKALHANNIESAVEYLDKLKEKGYTSDKYKEIKQAADEWGLSGSYRDGLWKVPADGHRAILHEGEAVLTKEDADIWRSEVGSRENYAMYESLPEITHKEDKPLPEITHKEDKQPLEPLSKVGGRELDQEDINIPAFRVGTNYIDKDQVAYLHEGEAVVPKAYNPAANKNELETLREQAQRSQETRSQEESETTEYIKLTSELLSEIKEFLAVWKEDNVKREIINNSKNQYSSGTNRISRYFV